jgi:hypothetical protein
LLTGRKLEDLRGRNFGEWGVLYLSEDRAVRSAKWICMCSCGALGEIAANSLKRGTSKSCGHSQKLQPYEYLYRILLSSIRSKRSHVPMELTLEEFLSFTKQKRCHYCNTPLRWSEKNIRGAKLTGYNLDRKDNSLGYTFSNCVVCCKRCNMAKLNHFSYDEWKQIGMLIRSWKDIDGSVNAAIYFANNQGE